MDELTTNLQLMETISASDAMNNARTVLEEAAEDMDTEALGSDPPLRVSFAASGA